MHIFTFCRGEDLPATTRFFHSNLSVSFHHGEKIYCDFCESRLLWFWKFSFFLCEAWPVYLEWNGPFRDQKRRLALKKKLWFVQEMRTILVLVLKPAIIFQWFLRAFLLLFWSVTKCALLCKINKNCKSDAKNLSNFPEETRFKHFIASTT